MYTLKIVEGIKTIGQVNVPIIAVSVSSSEGVLSHNDCANARDAKSEIDRLRLTYPIDFFAVSNPAFTSMLS